MPESWSETCCTAHFPGDVHYTRGSRLQLSRPALPLRVCFEDQVVISWANLWRRQTNTFLRSCVVQHRLAALTASVPGCPFNLPADCSSESACNWPVDARSQLVPSHGTSTACLLPPARGLCAGAAAEPSVARQPVMSILCAAASLPCCPPALCGGFSHLGSGPLQCKPFLGRIPGNPGPVAACAATLGEHSILPGILCQPSVLAGGSF